MWGIGWGRVWGGGTEGAGKDDTQGSSRCQGRKQGGSRAAEEQRLQGVSNRLRSKSPSRGIQGWV